MKKTMKKTIKILAFLGLLTGLLLGLATTAFAAGQKVSTKKEAKTIAAKAAGVKKSNVEKWIKVKLDNWDDDGTKEWDVEFKTKTHYYEVEINSRTGRVEDFDQQKITASTKITKNKAKKIALKTAGEPESAVKEWTSILKKSDEWELKFRTKAYKYEVDISLRSGRVTDFDRKKIASASSKNIITKNKAKEIALNDAKAWKSLKGNPNFITVKLDYDDGKRVYEVEFRYGIKEFEYEIRARDGEILQRDFDYDD